MTEDSVSLLVQLSPVQGGHVLVTLHGELDLDSGAKLDDALTRQVASGSARILLDLSSVSFMDSFGLRILVHGERRCREAGGVLALIAPTPTVARVLRLTGLTLMVPVYACVDDALAGRTASAE